MKNRVLCVAGLALSVSSAAVAQPVVDGSRDAQYGQPVYVNTQNPTLFGDNNYTPPPPCSPTSGADVTTGIEVRVPLANIGNPAAGSIRIAGFISSGSYDFVSNQVIGGLPPSANLGDPHNIDFSSLPMGGNQFVGVATAAAAPTVDGTLDAAYTAAVPSPWTQNQGTGFGNSTSGQVASANGSEIDGAYAVVNGGFLYIFITGNLETNFNKLSLFIDTGAGGQNQLRGDNPNVDFNGLNRMGGATNGLKFDAGFDANYWIGITNGGSPSTIHVNASELLAGGGGTGGYAGNTTHASNGVLAGGDNNFLGLEATINNSNVGGVDGCVPPSSGADFANGSEIDAVYAYRDATHLYLFVSGNLETNGNTLSLFFDVQAGGQNRLRNDNVDVDFNGLNHMGVRQVTVPIDPNDPLCQVADPCNNGCPCQTLSYPGLKFDDGFEADYWVSFKNNNNPNVMYAHAATLRTNGRNMDVLFNSLDYGSYFYAAKAVTNPLNFPASFYDVQQDPFVNPQGTLPYLYTDAAPRLISQDPYHPAAHAVPGLILASLNNSNTAGVTGAAADGSAASSVATGMEFRIRLDELGAGPNDPIRLAGFIANGDYTNSSNQVIGGLPAAAGNLGETASADFSTIAGNQFVTINPPGGSADCFTRGAPGPNGPCGVPTHARPQNAGHFTRGNGDGLNDANQCISDWDGDGCVNPADVAAFIASWFYSAQNPGNVDGDLDCSQSAEPADVAAFVGTWFAGITNPTAVGC